MSKSATVAVRKKRKAPPVRRGLRIQQRHLQNVAQPKVTGLGLGDLLAAFVLDCKDIDRSPHGDGIGTYCTRHH